MGSTIAAYYAVSAWSQVLIWPAKQAPHYKVGWQVSVALFVCLLIGLVTLRIIDVRYIRPKNHRIAMEKKMAEEDAARQANGYDADDDVKEGYEGDLVIDSKDKVTVGDLAKVSVQPIPRE